MLSQLGSLVSKPQYPHKPGPVYLYTCWHIKPLYTRWMEEDELPGYKKTPPEWCDDCVSAPGSTCPICGCTHNC